MMKGEAVMLITLLIILSLKDVTLTSLGFTLQPKPAAVGGTMVLARSQRHIASMVPPDNLVGCISSFGK